MVRRTPDHFSVTNCYIVWGALRGVHEPYAEVKRSRRLSFVRVNRSCAYIFDIA